MRLTDLQVTWLDSVRQQLDATGRVEIAEATFLTADSVVSMASLQADACEHRTLREWIQQADEQNAPPAPVPEGT